MPSSTSTTEEQYTSADNYSEAPVNSDASYSTVATNLIAEAGKRVSAHFRKKALSDANQTAPANQKDANGNTVAAGAPSVLSPLFGSPLALGQGRGPYGPSGERYITSDYGEARNVTNAQGVRTGGRTHRGIDLRCPNGEIVYAMADGTVTFVGVQTRTEGGKSVGHPIVDPATHNIVDADTGKVVAAVGPPNNIAYGGIFVQITHSGNFSGYQTEYFHLSDVLVRQKTNGKATKVKKGDPIAVTGQSGGDKGTTSGPHLHLQVRRNGVLIDPAFTFPNYKPNTRLLAVNGAITQGAKSMVAQQAASGTLRAGAAIVGNNLTNQLQCTDREAACANQSSADMKERQSDHANSVASNVDAHTMALYQAVASFQQQLPTFDNPVYFDFDTGLWSDQQTPPVSGTGL